MVSSTVNESIKKDLQQLEQMALQHSKFLSKLENAELHHHERQSIEAGIMMLKEFMLNKSQDIKRQLRNTQEY